MYNKIRAETVNGFHFQEKDKKSACFINFLIKLKADCIKDYFMLYLNKKGGDSYEGCGCRLAQYRI